MSGEQDLVSWGPVRTDVERVSGGGDLTLLPTVGGHHHESDARAVRVEPHEDDRSARRRVRTRDVVSAVTRRITAPVSGEMEYRPFRAGLESSHPSQVRVFPSGDQEPVPQPMLRVGSVRGNGR